MGPKIFLPSFSATNDAMLELFRESFLKRGALALSVSSKTILTPQDDDIPVPAQKSSPKRSWIHTLVLWLYPAFSYFAVMAVFITMMRALTRRHAAQFLASVSAGSAPAPPLEDLLLPNFSADYANIFDSL
eukprot:171265_1